MDLLPAPGGQDESIELSLLGVLGEDDLHLLSSLDDYDDTSEGDAIELGDASRKRKKSLLSEEERK